MVDELCCPWFLLVVAIIRNMLIDKALQHSASTALILPESAASMPAFFRKWK